MKVSRNKEISYFPNDIQDLFLNFVCPRDWANFGLLSKMFRQRAYGKLNRSTNKVDDLDYYEFLHLVSVIGHFESGQQTIGLLSFLTSKMHSFASTKNSIFSMIYINQLFLLNLRTFGGIISPVMTGNKKNPNIMIGL